MPGRKFGKNTRAKVFPGGFVAFRMENPQGFDDWVVDMNAKEERIKDFRPVWRRFGPYMIRSIDRTFAAQGRPAGWAAIGPAYRQWKLNNGYSGNILEMTGQMRRGFVFDYGRDSFRIRNKKEDIFNIHQYGAPRANIPPRIMVQLLTQDKREFTRLYNAHIRGGSNG